MQKVFRHRKKAEITVFLTLLLVVITTFFLFLLEAGRLRGLRTKAQLVTDLGVESLFSQYKKEIYEEYGLCMMDDGIEAGEFSIASVEAQLGKYLDVNTATSGKTLYDIRCKECKISKYQLLTDKEGAAFRQLAASQGRRISALQAADKVKEEISDRILQQKKQNQDNGTADDLMQDAKEKEQEAETEKTEDNSAGEQREEVKNPIESAADMKKSTLLELVLEDTSGISHKAISIETPLTVRPMAHGNLPPEDALIDDVWFACYLEHYMNYYGKKDREHVLDYEVEYILGEADCDYENLEHVAKNLIMIRETANLAYLASSKEKQAEAQGLATALMGWTGNPAVITATKWGVLAAWAYWESVLDVRALLAGRRIPWVKTKEQWESDIQGAITNDGFHMTADCKSGWDYWDYLKFLLLMSREKDVNYRALELIEENTCVKSGRECRIDTMICAVEVSVDYEAQTEFNHSFDWTGLHNLHCDGGYAYEE